MLQVAPAGQLQLAPVQASFPTSLLQATDNKSSGSRRKILITQLYQFLLQELLSLRVPGRRMNENVRDEPIDRRLKSAPARSQCAVHCGPLG